MAGDGSSEQGELYGVADIFAQREEELVEAVRGFPQVQAIWEQGGETRLPSGLEVQVVVDLTTGERGLAISHPLDSQRVMLQTGTSSQKAIAQQLRVPTTTGLTVGVTDSKTGAALDSLPNGADFLRVAAYTTYYLKYPEHQLAEGEKVAMKISSLPAGLLPQQGRLLGTDGQPRRQTVVGWPGEVETVVDEVGPDDYQTIRRALDSLETGLASQTPVPSATLPGSR